VDESDTGSANTFGARVLRDTRPESFSTRKSPADFAPRSSDTSSKIAPVHLRAPSVDKGVQSFLWALFFFLYLFFGMLAIGVAKGNALIFSALAGFGIFFYIRIFGEESPRRVR
jgi:hypothetical protein